MGWHIIYGLGCIISSIAISNNKTGHWPQSHFGDCCKNTSPNTGDSVCKRYCTALMALFPLYFESNFESEHERSNEEAQPRCGFNRKTKANLFS